MCLGSSEQVMRDFSLAKITVFFVEYFANSSLLPSIFTLNTVILSHRKFHSDLFRASLKAYLRLNFKAMVFCVSSITRLNKTTHANYPVMIIDADIVRGFAVGETPYVLNHTMLSIVNPSNLSVSTQY